jgi:hypothetical protein
VTRRFAAIWNSVALTAAQAKTILELPTILNVPILIDEIFIGSSASAAGNMSIELGVFTTTGTGTALTPQPWGSDQGASKLTTGKIADSAEPTGFTQGTLGGTIRPAINIPLPGYFAYQAVPGKEYYVIDTPINFAVRLTSSITNTTFGWIAWTERA